MPLQRRKPLVAKKRMNKKGRQQLEYEKWRDGVAKPFLDETFGRVCSTPGCEATEGLQVDHIKNRGSRADLKMDLENVQYLCAYPCHYNKTYHIGGKQ